MKGLVDKKERMRPRQLTEKDGALKCAICKDYPFIKERRFTVYSAKQGKGNPSEFLGYMVYCDGHSESIVYYGKTMEEAINNWNSVMERINEMQIL